MAMVVNHNIPALTTYNTVNRTNSALEKSIQKLSTGLRINSAADDAAGLAISEKMRAQINGMDRAVANAQDGISMIQTAEGALSETHSILQRMRELSVQAANDTLTSQDRAYIQLEIDQLREEVTRIGNTTQFNKKKLLNGDAAVLWSSSDLSTKAVINGGMRSLDQFGQKVVTEGNYKISIKADPGQGEVQKSDIFKIKHEDVVMNKSINGSAGIKDVAVQNVPAGSYTLKSKVGAVAAAAQVTGQYGIVDLNVNDHEVDYSSMVAPASGNGAATITITDSSGHTLYTGNAVVAEGANAAAMKTALTTALNAAKTAANGANYGYTIGDIVDDGTSKLTFSTTRKDGKEAEEITISWSQGTAPTVTAAGSEERPADLTQIFTVTPTDNQLDGNASVLFEVTDINTEAGTMTLKATASILSTDGVNTTSTVDNIVLKSGATTPTNIPIALVGGEDNAGTITPALTMKLTDGYLNNFSTGSKFVYSINKADGADMSVQLTSTINDDWEHSWAGGPLQGKTVNYGLDSTKVAGKDIHFKNYYLNEKTGEVSEGDIILTTTSEFNTTNAPDGTALASFDAAYVGQVAKGDVALRDLDKFWTSEGVFMLTDPQTITLTQGDGTSSSVTLYATDTLNEVKEKLNTAIASGLGQGQYVDDASKFVTFVEDKGSNSEAVEGTFLIRSVIPGAQGAISFSGDENIINAFSLNNIQTAKESKYTVDVEDAHTGAVVASGVKVTGNKLVGVIHPNVDVEFDSLSGVSASWDSSRNAFVYNAKETETILHLSDNTTVFQIGANEGEDMNIYIGDMRATALGLDSVLVTNRESAARSITILDNAIDKVSMQRAKLGAYQNRLEHTINNLNTASENITAAESRIRDTDMAKEMMNFTKLQIMLQAGTSMLAQANQLPQNVLSLIR